MIDCSVIAALAHGAESTLVSDIMRRIGLACGVNEVAVALSANALVVPEPQLHLQPLAKWRTQVDQYRLLGVTKAV